MKESSNSKKEAVLYGTTTAISILALAVFAGVRPEINDDFAVSVLLARTFEGGTPYQWKFLQIVLHLMYSLIPGINHWTVFNLLGMAIGIGAVAYYFYIIILVRLLD